MIFGVNFGRGTTLLHMLGVLLLSIMFNGLSCDSVLVSSKENNTQLNIRQQKIPIYVNILPVKHVCRIQSLFFIFRMPTYR